MRSPDRSRAGAPLWLKLAATGFVIVLVPYYNHHYGWQNFLWLSDIALFATVVALWRESRLIISMMAVGVLPLELYWNVAFFVRVASGIELGLVDYMFDDALPLSLRALSLFHVALPIIWITLLLRWGYDPRALVWQTLLLWAVLVATRLFTDPDENINWVFAPRAMSWDWLPGPVWLLACIVLLPLVVHWPLHRLYSRYPGVSR